MRIDDKQRVSLEPSVKPQRKTAGAESPSAAATASSAPTAGSTDESRSERIDKLKQMFREGQPIDVNKLADKLIESGLFFNEKA